MDFLKKIFNKDVVEKAGKSNDQSFSSIETIMPNRIILTNDPVALCSLNKGIAYACNSIIAKYIASTNLHLYHVNKTNKKDFIIPTQKCNKLITKEINHLARTKQITEIVEILDHPALKLIENPSKEFDISELLTITSSYLGILGNAYIEIIRSGNKIVELFPLRSEYVEINTDINGKIAYYKYLPERGTQRIIQPNDMLHLRTPTGGSNIVGYGWFEAAQSSIRLSLEMDTHMATLATNLGQPGQLVTLKGDFKNQEEANAATKAFQDKFSRNNRGKPLVSTGDVTVTTLSTSPKDMVYEEHFKRILTTICSCSGVPEDIVTSQNSNRASSTTAMTTFFTNTIIPNLSIILNGLNKQVISEYDDNLYIWFDPSEVVKEDETASTNNTIALVNAGIITTEEAKARLGIAL